MVRSVASIRDMVVLAIIASTLAGCARVRNLLVDPAGETRRLAQRARDAADVQDFKTAQTLLARANDLSPNDPDVHRLKSRVLFAQGKSQEAIQELRIAVEHDPTDAASRVQLAQKLVESGAKGNEAADRLREALQLNPTHVDGMLLKARLAEQAGQPEVAMETLHRVLSCNAEQPDAKLRLAHLQSESGHAERAAPLLRSICDCPHSTPAQRAEACWQLGVIYGREKRWADSAEALTEAATIRKELSADEWYRVAFARFQAEEFEGARQAVSSCLAQNAKHEGGKALSASFQAYGWGDATSSAQPIVPAEYSANLFPTPQGW